MGTSTNLELLQWSILPHWRLIWNLNINSRLGKPVLIPGGYFPDDLDTTSMALITLRPDAKLVTSLLDDMLTYMNPDGTFQVSLDI